MKSPLAARSSSLLEDAREHPFAGVYATKMIPNDSPSPDERFRRLVEAIKLVWASTFFRAARSYREAVGAGALDERMAVVLQEVVGRRHGERFYPDVSGVARSWAFYRSGRTRPRDGVVQLALGLGKTVVDAATRRGPTRRPTRRRRLPTGASPSSSARPRRRSGPSGSASRRPGTRCTTRSTS